MRDTRPVVIWQGRNVEQLSRAELIWIIHQISRQVEVQAATLADIWRQRRDEVDNPGRHNGP